jgi:hypothetical protein
MIAPEGLFMDNNAVDNVFGRWRDLSDARSSNGRDAAQLRS